MSHTLRLSIIQTLDKHARWLVQAKVSDNMERKSPEYILEVFADYASVKQIVKGK